MGPKNNSNIPMVQGLGSNNQTDSSATGENFIKLNIPKFDINTTSNNNQLKNFKKIIKKPNALFFHMQQGIYRPKDLENYLIKKLYVLNKAKRELLDWIDSLTPDLLNQEYDTLHTTGWIKNKRTKLSNTTVIRETIIGGHLDILKRLNDRFRLAHSNTNNDNKGLNRPNYESNINIKKKKIQKK